MFFFVKLFSTQSNIVVSYIICIVMKNENLIFVQDQE